MQGMTSVHLRANYTLANGTVHFFSLARKPFNWPTGTAVTT